MKKSLIAFGFAAVLAFAMTACGANSSGASGGNSQKTTSAKPVELVLTESGYTTDSSGYVHYAVCLENTNADKAAEFPVVTIVGKDGDGAIVFSDDWVIGKVLPGEKAYYASQAGNGTAAKTVEFSVATDSEKWKTADTYPAGVYSIENTNYIEGKYGMASFTGQITLTQDNEDFAAPMIVVVLRDGDGAIVGGYSTYLSGKLTKDKPTAFELRAHSLPEFASFEVYANPWF